MAEPAARPAPVAMRASTRPLRPTAGARGADRAVAGLSRVMAVLRSVGRQVSAARPTLRPAACRDPAEVLRPPSFPTGPAARFPQRPVPRLEEDNPEDGPMTTPYPAILAPRFGDSGPLSPPSADELPHRQHRWLPPAALAAVAVVWGVTFTVMDGAAEVLPAADLVVWRFGLATAVLALVRRAAPPLPRPLRLRGLALGVLLGSGFLLQAWALRYTDALMSGFLTGLLVVVAPVAAWLLFGERLGPGTWSGVVLAAAGVVVLSFHGAGTGPGELLTLASAAVWGLHLVLLSRWSRAEHALDLARLQTGAVTALALAVLVVRALAAGPSPLPALPAGAATWGSVGFLAVVATALAMVLLSWSQARVAAARAAVILTLEPAVSGLTAAVTGAALTGRVVVGAVLLVVAMYVVELARRPSRQHSPCPQPLPLVAGEKRVLHRGGQVEAAADVHGVVVGVHPERLPR